jgi:nitrate/nitrite transporter NarK
LVKSFHVPYETARAHTQGRVVTSEPASNSPLNRARFKIYWRRRPLLFLAYVIAFVDRANVAFAKLTMTKDLPAFWTLPCMFLTSTAAAASIGLINSVGNLGGQFGPYVLGKVETVTGSFGGGLYFLAVSMLGCATIVFLLGLGKREPARPSGETPG